MFPAVMQGRSEAVGLKQLKLHTEYRMHESILDLLT